MKKYTVLMAIGVTTAMETAAWAEVATTIPTPAKAPSVHSLWSQRAFAVSDGENQVSYVNVLAHDATITWNEHSVDSSDRPNPWSHFFRSRTWIRACAACAPTLYEFQLTDVEWSDANSISGDWAVLKDGVVKSSRCKGSAIGLEQAIGSRFELTCTSLDAVRANSVWGFFGYITNRFDW